MALPPELATPRLKLRRLTEADLPALTEAAGNYEVSRWLSVVPYPYSEADARRFLGKAETARSVWGVFDAARFVGIVKLTSELSFWFSRPVWGRGYAGEAISPLLEAHFASRRAGPITARYFAGNDRSGRVLERLGFRVVGKAPAQARVLGQQMAAVEAELTRAAWRAR